MMKKYKFIQPAGNDQVEEVILNEEEILKDYWEFWSRKMIEKYGLGHELITSSNCVDDWCVTHWAMEVK